MKKKDVLKISTKMKGVKEEDVYSTVYRKINRIFAMKLAEKIANNTKITPNQLTFIPLFLYIITAILFYINKQPYLIFGGVVFLLSYFMDQLNGSLARIKNMANDFGGWLDGISDTFGLTMIYLGATIGIYRTTNLNLVWLFGFLSVTSYLYGNWLYITFRMLFNFSTKEIEKIKKRRIFIRNFFYNGNFVIPMFALAAFFNKIYWLLAFFSVYGWLYCFALVFGLTKSISKYYK